MTSVWLSKLKLPVALLVIQVAFVLLFAFCVEYDSQASPILHANHGANGSDDVLQEYYPSRFSVYVFI